MSQGECHCGGGAVLEDPTQLRTSEMGQRPCPGPTVPGAGTSHPGNQPLPMLKGKDVNRKA